MHFSDEPETKTLPSARKKILIFWFFLLLASGFLKTSLASLPGSHGGKMVVREGRSFEIVSNPGLRQLKVYAAPKAGIPEQSLTVYMRSRGKSRNRIKLVLSETTPEAWVYSGLVPANILIGAGIRLEVDLK